MNRYELEQRFRRLFAAEYSYVLAYALRRTTNSADAQDIVAETFTVAWRRIRDAPAYAEIRPWLYAIAARTLANQHRVGHRSRTPIASSTAVRTPSSSTGHAEALADEIHVPNSSPSRGWATRCLLGECGTSSYVRS
jgi:DNA-directed RNA polymerase specialized sigma24 family protein